MRVSKERRSKEEGEHAGESLSMRVRSLEHAGESLEHAGDYGRQEAGQ